MYHAAAARRTDPRLIYICYSIMTRKYKLVNTWSASTTLYWYMPGII